MNAIASAVLLAVLFAGATKTARAQSEDDIQSYGVRCDGSDETAAVQRALSSIPTGGTLYFSCMVGISQVSLSGGSEITIAGKNGGGVTLLFQTGDAWAKAFTIRRCASCTIRDLVFDGNDKNIIPFNIEESSDTTVRGLTVRNVRDAGAAFLATHNTGNKYLGNRLENIGMDRSPGPTDTTRGIWIGGVSDSEKETNVTVSGNNFADISATAIVVHGSGITVTNNTGVRLNWSCIKVLPLGGTGSTLVANNNCSGAGARWLIGGGIMTEYYNSSYEQTVIRENTVEGYGPGDVTRIPDSPNVGINIANSPDKTTHNVQILKNTIRNTLYDGIQISGPLENFVIENNLIERTITSGTQWTGISLQGVKGGVVSKGVVRTNLVKGKFDGIYLSADAGKINDVVFQTNAVLSTSRDGLHIEVQNGGLVSGLSMNGDSCFSSIGRRIVWDNRPKDAQLVYVQQLPINRRTGGPIAPACSDPRTPEENGR
jgi:hypothetical protein